MKHAICAFLLAFSIAGFSAVPAQITSFPDGRFLGSGVWSDNSGHSGAYEVYYTFVSNNLRADSAWKSGAQTIDLSFAFSPTGAVTIDQDGNTIGGGQCNSYSCNYSFTIGTNFYSNTIYFLPGLYIEIGFGLIDGKTIRWQDFLQEV